MTQSGFGLRKIVLTIALAVLLFAAFTAVASAATIYVPDDHGTIQDAVNAANPGDIIIVRDGTYTENVKVNKRLTIRSENGAASTTVQASNPNDDVFGVTADDVTISGFTVKGATEAPNAGIYLSGADYCIISDNKVSNNYLGIWLLDSSGNELAGNIANSNNYDGILLSESSGNKLTSNTANSNNNYYGIWLGSSSGNTLTSNTADSNNVGGIALFESSDNTLTGNTANSNNVCGIGLVRDSSGNTLTGNTANSNHEAGIALRESSGNTLTGNTANANNECGISLVRDSSSNTLTSNTASNNEYGIHLYDSSGNTLTSNTASNNEHGIFMRDSSGNTLMDNIANLNNGIGIWLYESNGNILTGNTANSNKHDGIQLGDSSHNTLTSNTANSNSQIGITLGSSNANTLTSNTANSNNMEGIMLAASSGNTLTTNTASNNDCGIMLGPSSDNTLTSNTASDNWNEGIVLVDSNDNTLTGNTANSNGNYGIYLYSSSGNTFTGNTVSNNDYGIYFLERSSNNKIYINNFISNTNNVRPDGSNDWNSPSKITYTYKRRTYRNYLGNYWDDYTDVDANNDGIWDTSYSINSDNDNYPLVGRIDNHEIAPYYVHDMAVTDVYTDPSPPTVGQSTTIYVTVENEGDLQENNVPVTVKAYVGLSPFGRQVGSTRVTLSAGDSTTESFTWTPSMAKTYYIKGEVGIVGGERDTSDNTKTISVSVPPKNQAPTCAIELRKQGTTTSINEIDVGEFFDIYVGDSTDDTCIREVRFSSDDSQDGNPTGEWTMWYGWDTSEDDWDAVSKIMSWTFTTEGSKEVWAEVKDGDGQARKCSANIYAYAIANQPPVALFTYSPEKPKADEWVTFDASDSYDPDGEIVSYEWDFGDDSMGEGEVVTYAYSSEGIYTVTLTVTDDDGAEGYCEKIITVSGEKLNEFWVEVNRDNASIYDREEEKDIPNLSKPLKRLPVGWVLKRLTEGDKPIEGTPDGIRWFNKVEDVTDGTIGWVERGDLKEGGKNRVKKLDTKDERIPRILHAVTEHRTEFLPDNFPPGIILAMIAQEAPSDFDNEFVSFDCGRGIMQTTTNEYVGCGSGIECYSNGAECLQYTHVKDKELTIFDENEDPISYCHGSCCYDEKSKDLSCCSICENIKNGENADDCGKTSYCEEKKDLNWRCTCRHNNNCKCKHYTNTTQGIEANIKDGLYVLGDKYNCQCCNDRGKDAEWDEEEGLYREEMGGEVIFYSIEEECKGSDGQTYDSRIEKIKIGDVQISCNEFKVIDATWRYNGRSIYPEGSCMGNDYLRCVADRLNESERIFGYKMPSKDTWIESLKAVSRSASVMKKIK